MIVVGVLFEHAIVTTYVGTFALNTFLRLQQYFPIFVPTNFECNRIGRTRLVRSFVLALPTNSP